MKFNSMRNQAHHEWEWFNILVGGGWARFLTIDRCDRAGGSAIPTEIPPPDVISKRKPLNIRNRSMITITWRKKLTELLARDGKTWSDLIGCTLTDEQADAELIPYYDRVQGASFTAWTENRVYFPVCYDGAEWIGSVPRHPCNEKTEHMGGGQRS